MKKRKQEFDLSLSEHFIDSARRNWGRRCLADVTGKRLSYGKTLVSAVTIAEQLGKLTEGQDKIGILLPSSVAGALANLAVALLGKVSVNLNYSCSEQIVKSAIEQCGIKTIISSRSFAEKLVHFENLKGLIYFEDITEKAGITAKIKAYLEARFANRRALANAHEHERNNPATIIFSSGTTGVPKGVMLSHNNIFSNTQATSKTILLKPQDNLCAVLPFFHSFGLTCGLWLPLFSGASAAYALNPLDSNSVETAASENKSTVLFAVPTFFLNYIKKIRPEAFANLRIVMAGAEKLKVPIADSFEEKFGIRPLEGYGATELSPVVSLNLTDELSTGLYKAGQREGTVGLPLPGIEVKIVSTQTGEELPVGKSGLLMVKGPNVMLGYLDKPDETAEVLRDGWYDTGDIANINEDGFITIEDRLSRFSKIGGEMVPHLGVENVYLEGLGTQEQVVAVTGIPNAKKGEELVVLYTDKAGNVNKLREIISKSDLPNTWKPRRENYIRIESIPALGSGKLNIAQLQKIAKIAKNSSTNQQ